MNRRSMHSGRPLAAALALLLAAAVPARATTTPTIHFVEINPGSDGSFAIDQSDTIAFGDWLYFAADDGTHGSELWRTDGDTTQMVKDINPTAGQGSSVSDFAAMGGYLYFSASNGNTANGRELWRTDGTGAGTTMVKDIRVGTPGSNVTELETLGGYVYFRANDGSIGEELWRTDGTAAGTTLVMDIRPGGAISHSQPVYLTRFGDWIYFSADDGGSAGRELWRTNGATTEPVKDINPGAPSSSPQYFTPIGIFLAFVANDGTNGSELWVTDGTESGTHMVGDLNGSAGSFPNDLTAFDGALYFSALDSTGANPGRELFRSPNPTSVELASDINPSGNSSPQGLVALGDRLFFQADDGTSGNELWSFDGTSPSLVADINPSDSSDPFYVSWGKVIGDALYFVASSDGSLGSLYRIEATASTPEVVAPTDPTLWFTWNSCNNCGPTYLSVLGGRLFFSIGDDGSVYGQEFGYLDEPTYVAPELPPTSRESSPWGVALVLFAALTAAAGVRLLAREGERP